MSDFAPSVDAARRALGQSTPIETSAHPGGAAGSKFSLEQVAAKVREGRNDPRVRAWAGKVLLDAGKPSGVRGQTQALLDALRKQTVYAPDPINTEMISKAHVTLCLDNHGLCLQAADCDDLTVALASATMSIGIPTKVVGQAFERGAKAASHVLLAVEDPTWGWLKVDPSSKTYNVGDSHPLCTREWELNPMDTVHKSLEGSKDAGDYVAIGAIPQGLGQASPSSSDVILGQVQSAIYRLQTSKNNLAASLQKIQQTRILMRPSNPFDPEPSGVSINGLSDFPPGAVWTQRMDAVATQTWDVADKLTTYGLEAIKGIRRIFIDPNSAQPFIESKATDPWSIQVVAHTAESLIIGFFDPGGNIISGVDSKTGAAYSASQVQQAAAAAQGAPQGTGQAQVIVGIVAGTVIAVALVYAWIKYCEMASVKAEAIVEDDIAKCISVGNCPTTALQAYQQNKIIEKQADAANRREDPFSKGLENLGTVFMWTAIGGIAVAGTILLAPVVKEFVASHAARRESQTHPLPNPRRRRRR